MMISFSRTPSSMATRVRTGMQSIAVRSCRMCERLVRIGSPPPERRLRRLRRYAPTSAWASISLSPERNPAHAAWRSHRLLGPRAHDGGPAGDRAGGRAARLRLDLGRGGLRLRRSDRARVAGGGDLEDQAGIGDLP